MAITLYSYFNSSASFRVRIGLALKGLDFKLVPINIKPGADEQFSPDFLSLNPEARVPFLHDGDINIAQSLAILDYLDERYPAPAFLPKSHADRAFVRSIVQLIVADIHPINNLAILRYLKATFGADQDATDTWYRHWIERGFKALEQKLDGASPFCFGNRPTLADICLIPQVNNARRFNLDLDPFPKITAIEARAYQLDAFEGARPHNQPDFPKD